MKQKNVLISGAGIAGPVLGWWLVRYGFRPVIIERWPQLRSGGQNIDISGAAQEIVAKMGLEKDIKAANTGEQGLMRIPMISPTYSDFISPIIPGLFRPGDARLSAA